MSDLLSVRDIEFRNAVKELKEKQKTGSLLEISIHCFGCDTLLDFGSFNLFITDTSFWCLDRFNKVNIWMDEETTFKTAKKAHEWFYPLTKPSSSFKLYFLENLPSVKEEIDKILKQAEEIKKLGMKDIIEGLALEKEEKDEIIETNIIDFGYRTIEIISNGSVVLIDKQKELERQGQIQNLATTLNNQNKKQMKKLVSALEQAKQKQPKKLIKVLKQKKKRQEGNV